MLIKKNSASLLLVVLIATTTSAQASLSDSVKSILARMQNNAIARQITARRVGYLVLGAGAVATTAGLWWWLKNRAAASSSPTAVSSGSSVTPLQETPLPEQNQLLDNPASRSESQMAANASSTQAPVTPLQETPLQVQNQPLGSATSGSSPRTPTASALSTLVSDGQNPISTLSLAATSLNGSGRRDVEGEKEQETNRLVPTSSAVDWPKSARSIKHGFALRQGSVGKMMDDRYDVDEDDSRFNFYAVYDGHGNTYTDLGGGLFADILAHGHEKEPSLIRSIKANLDKGQDVKQACTMAFLDMDQYLRGIDATSPVGSTAVIAIIDKLQKTINFALVGDSRAVVLDKNGDVLDATVDNEIVGDERKRIEDAIAKIVGSGAPSDINRKITEGEGGIRFSGLPMSRAFGDFREKDLAPGGVIAEPVVTSVKNGKAAYIVLASDGVWDAIKNDEVYQAMRTTLTAPEQEISKKILDGWTADDYCFPPGYQLTRRTSADEIIDAGGADEPMAYAQHLRDKAFYINVKESLDDKESGKAAGRDPSQIMSDNIAVIVVDVKGLYE